MDPRGHEALRDNVIGEYAHAGLGLLLGLISGILATALWHSIALGLALGVVLGLVLEVVFEMSDRRNVACPPPALEPVHEVAAHRAAGRRHRTVMRH